MHVNKIIKSGKVIISCLASISILSVVIILARLHASPDTLDIKPGPTSTPDAFHDQHKQFVSNHTVSIVECDATIVLLWSRLDELAPNAVNALYRLRASLSSSQTLQLLCFSDSCQSKIDNLDLPSTEISLVKPAALFDGTPLDKWWGPASQSFLQTKLTAGRHFEAQLESAVALAVAWRSSANASLLLINSEALSRSPILWNVPRCSAEYWLVAPDLMYGNTRRQYPQHDVIVSRASANVPEPFILYLPEQRYNSFLENLVAQFLDNVLPPNIDAIVSSKRCGLPSASYLHEHTLIDIMTSTFNNESCVEPKYDNVYAYSRPVNINNGQSMLNENKPEKFGEVSHDAEEFSKVNRRTNSENTQFQDSNRLSLTDFLLALLYLPSFDINWTKNGTISRQALEKEMLSRLTDIFVPERVTGTDPVAASNIFPWNNPATLLTCAHTQGQLASQLPQNIPSSTFPAKVGHFTDNIPTLRRQAFYLTYLRRCATLLVKPTLFGGQRRSRAKPRLNKQARITISGLTPAMYDLLKELPVAGNAEEVELHFETHQYEILHRDLLANHLQEALQNVSKILTGADLVITQCLDTALLCAANDIPVAYITLSAWPPESVPNKTALRQNLLRPVANLTQLFHTLSLSQYEILEVTERKRVHERVAKWFNELPWKTPPTNPNPGMLMRLRATMWAVARQHSATRNVAVLSSENEVLFPSLTRDIVDLMSETEYVHLSTSMDMTFNTETSNSAALSSIPQSNLVDARNSPQHSNGALLDVTGEPSDAHLLPMTAAPQHHPLSQRSRLIFHMIFTTSADSRIRIFQTNDTVSGAWGFRHWRALESALRHHPDAKIFIHSNTLSMRAFDTLTEAGYDVTVRRYDLGEMLARSPAADFAAKIDKVRRGPFWYSHETDLLRLLVLYRWGGVYLDTDVIVVRPLRDGVLPTAALGIEAQLKNGVVELNGAVMKFDTPAHPFLRAALVEYATNYGWNWGSNGPALLSRLRRAWPGGAAASGVTLVPKDAFYMFHYSRVSGDCFGVVSNKTLDRLMATLKKSAYAVHLNSKMTGKEGANGEALREGSICKYLMNAFCILCNHEY